MYQYITTFNITTWQYTVHFSLGSFGRFDIGGGKGGLGS